MGRIWGIISNVSTLWGLLPGSWQVALLGGITLVTGWLGYGEGGLFYAIIGATIVLAFGLLSFLIWIVITRLTSVYERFSVESITIANGNIEAVKGARNKYKLKHPTLEIRFKNVSPTQTLYFRVKRASHSIDGLGLKSPAAINETITAVAPQTVQKFLMPTLPDVDIKNELKGLVEFEILYGPKSDNLCYLFTYQSQPGFSFTIQKRGQSQITVNSPILKLSHEKITAGAGSFGRLSRELS